MKIGELAQAAQCTPETVRYYEKAGLLPPPSRSDGNYRVYGPAHLERLVFVRHCRALDMTHEEICELLELRDVPDADCAQVNVLLDAHIEHVERRIRDLNTLREQLASLRHQCQIASATRDCGILQALAHEPLPEPRPAACDGHGLGVHD